MKAYLIDPYEKQITVIHVDNESEKIDVLEGPAIEGLIFPSKDVLYVNEEMVSIPDKNFFAIKGYGGEVFSHYGLVLGGNDKNVSMSLREIKRKVIYIFPEDAFSGEWKKYIW